MPNKFNPFMRKNYRTNLYSIAILMCMLYSCGPKSVSEKILSLEYEQYSGEIGKSFSIFINQDSAKLFMRLSGEEDPVVKEKKISPADWAKLLNSFSLENFKSVKDGKSNAPRDGRDEIFTIKTQANTYRLVNGSTDWLRYWRIRGLTKSLLRYKNGNL